jgi:hypothetical protein
MTCESVEYIMAKLYNALNDVISIGDWEENAKDYEPDDYNGFIKKLFDLSKGYDLPALVHAFSWVLSRRAEEVEYELMGDEEE